MKNIKDWGYLDNLDQILSLPHKILDHHINNIDNIIDMVFYSLCNENFFNMDKAAYLIDNPDFNILKGIAGFDKKNNYKKKYSNGIDRSDIWQFKDYFKEHINNCEFNNSVKNFLGTSIFSSIYNIDDKIKNIAKSININNPRYYTWLTKNDNYAMVIFESPNEISKDLLLHLRLLSLCPI
jgi:hypothetical protein